MLRDKVKTTPEGKPLGNGIGFIEFGNEEVAAYGIRYLNNMELVNNKGLIVDHSLDDARIVNKREKKLQI